VYNADMNNNKKMGRTAVVIISIIITVRGMINV